MILRKFNFFITSIILITWALLLYVGITDIITKDYWRTIIWAIFILMTLYAYFKVEHLTSTTQLLLNLIILADVFGERFTEIFYRFEYYDKILHFFVPIIMVIIFYDLLKIKIPENRRRMFIAALTTLSIGILWEILEMFFGIWFNSPMQGVFIHQVGAKHFFNFGINVMSPTLDTIYDTVCDAFGSIIGYFILKVNKY